MTEYQTTTVADGFVFPEGPRWRDGRLWFSDMWGRKVYTLVPGRAAEVVVDVPQRPSGLGWRPDGTAFVVSMEDHRLMRIDGSRLVEVADLSGIATGHANDMVIDTQGRAYVGNFGFDLLGGEQRLAKLALITPDGRVRVVAEELAFPNGTVITPDGRTLIIAESFAQRLTAFTIEADGSLSGRRVFAQFTDVAPDGICLDAEGAVWAANAFGTECVRVREGGEVVDRVVSPHSTFACMLGGPSGTTLYVCTADGTEEERVAGGGIGWIESAEVRVPRAGLP